MSRRIVVGLAAAVSAVVLVAMWLEPWTPATRHALGRVAVWDYQLQKPNLDRLAHSASDLVVMDYSRDGTGKGVVTAADVDRVRLRPDGGRRLVIAYLSIGEAEEYRYYWQPGWKTSPPDWLFAENCRWPGNHLVRFWMEPWKDIVYRGPNSYLAQIMAAGFDGVYLDRVDAYWDLRETYPNGRAEMIGFVRDLAAEARKRKRGFLVIAQNAEDLLSDASYRGSIDAIAKEDLLHGVDGSGVRNSPKLIDWSLGQLKLLQRDRKPVFVVEYLGKLEAVPGVRKELVSHGFTPTFPPRALDGSDPFEASAVVASAPQTGTPEYGTKHCK